MTRKTTLAVLALQLVAAVALAQSWYDNYDAGLDAARRGEWQAVVQKMNAAIKENPKEDNRAREYGTIFINYHPYYYRGVAYLNVGKYQEAISDLEKTMGPGEENLGSIESLIERAKARLAAAAAPPPQPASPQPVRPAPQPQPVVPAIDPALRQRAPAAITDAKQHIAQAQKRNATQSPQYNQAVGALAQANTRSAEAHTNDDLKAAIAAAENAAIYADAAAAPGIPPPPQPVTRPTAATRAVVDDTTQRVRRALESYFNGDFDDAATRFDQLAHEMPQNGWIWAFLGASQYSQYAFEADDSYRDAALKSFHRAKELRSWGKDGLPSKYFSKRIRKVFNNAG